MTIDPKAKKPANAPVMLTKNSDGSVTFTLPDGTKIVEHEKEFQIFFIKMMLME